MVNVLAEAGTGFQITTTMLEPIVDAVTDNLPVILTSGLAILGAVIVIRLVPRFIKIFTR